MNSMQAHHKFDVIYFQLLAIYTCVSTYFKMSLRRLNSPSTKNYDIKYTTFCGIFQQVSVEIFLQKNLKVQ